MYCEKVFNLDTGLNVSSEGVTFDIGLNTSSCSCYVFN